MHRSSLCRPPEYARAVSHRGKPGDVGVVHLLGGVAQRAPHAAAAKHLHHGAQRTVHDAREPSDRRCYTVPQWHDQNLMARVALGQSVWVKHNDN